LQVKAGVRVILEGRVRVGIVPQAEFNEAPSATKSMRIAIQDLELTHLWVVHPGIESFPVDAHLSALPLRDVGRISAELK
jgi:hypothetical protein